MKTKRIISRLLMAVLVLGCTVFPAGAEGEMRLESIVAIEEEIVWLDTSVGLAPFDKEGWQIDAAIYPEADAYAVGKDGNIYYSIDGDIFAFDRDGNAIDAWETPLDKIKKLQVNMANIRKKLCCKPGETRYIMNELGVGYRMLDARES